MAIKREASKKNISRGGHLPVLDHLRWIAAGLVCENHIRALLFRDYDSAHSQNVFESLFYFVTGYGGPSVVIFFVVSGFLVGGKALEILLSNPSSTKIERYFADRVSRIFIVAWPIVIISLILFVLIQSFAPNAPIMVSDNWDAGWPRPIGGDTGVAIWIGTFFLVNEFAVKTIVIDGVLWSLAYEWYCYVLAIVFICVTSGKSLLIASVLGSWLLVVTTIGIVHENAVLHFTLLWLMGIFAYVACGFCEERALKFAVPALFVFLAGLASWRFFHFGDFFIASITVVLCSQATAFQRVPFTKIGEKLAGFSFSLYVIHAPVIITSIVCLQANGLLLQREKVSPKWMLFYVGLSMLAYAVAWLFANFTEFRTALLRQKLRSYFAVR
ncbi:MAG: acyltransferase [Methylocystis sp.]